ncbi:DUF3237 family protein [Amycolatopsis thermoflava]
MPGHGDPVRATATRFRTAITFVTAEDSPEHAWLDHVVAVSSALRRPDAVLLDVYAVC